MNTHVVFFSWKAARAGRELISAEHFQDFVGYLSDLQGKGSIGAFQPVFLDPNGMINGFFLIHGSEEQIFALMASDAWTKHIVRAGFHLDGFAVSHGITGDLLQQRMQEWSSLIPSA
jgi:hypothetical protein